MRELTETERQTIVNALHLARDEYKKVRDTQRGLAKVPEMREQALRLVNQFSTQVAQVAKLAELIEQAETIQIEEPEPEEIEDEDDEPRDHPVDQLDYAWNEPGTPFGSGDY